MAAVLHLVDAELSPLATETIRQQLAAGDRITVVRLEGAPTPAVPGGVALRRVPDDLTYSQLLDLVFASDQVISW
ncbi:MAG: hypothetical protein HYR51_12370 [Candidatus Rokubacteria bacterium]|nr:hypothetical protein [Candidatus Rokubacteria bacterium]